MGFDYIGCVEKVAGELVPRWRNPCSTSDWLTGCFKPNEAGLRIPSLTAEFGECSFDQDGCMRKIDGIWRPVLEVTTWASSQEMLETCCIVCYACFPDFTQPTYITVTFSNLEFCAGKPGICIAGYPAPVLGDLNTEFTLEKILTGNPLSCIWEYDDRIVDGSGLYVRVQLYHYGDPIGLRGWVTCSWCHASPVVFNANAVVFDCLDTDFDNGATCGQPTTVCVNGSAVINWDPS